MRSHIHGRGAEAEAKSALPQIDPTPNFPHPLQNRALQTIFVLKKWQIRPRLLRVCVNIPTAAERECQNLPVSAPQPLRKYVDVALKCMLPGIWIQLFIEYYYLFTSNMKILGP